MDHTDHINLLRNAVTAGGVWADFGSGTGAFALALAELIGPSGTLHSIERDEYAVQQQQRAFADRFPDRRVHYHLADFNRPIDLPSLDGLVIANALHFYAQPEPIITRLKAYLKPSGCFIVVEYNVEHGNSAVPYPISFEHWRDLAQYAGFAHTELLATRPSRFLKEIYSAASR
ncbi:MAG: methyltransferase domain-containing protein [Anaerolineae bacterium]